MVRIEAPSQLPAMSDTGACRRAVDLHGAGAAHAVLAADVGAGQHQVPAQQVHELLARLSQHLPRLAVHDERDRNLAHGRPIRSTAPAQRRFSQGATPWGEVGNTSDDARCLGDGILHQRRRILDHQRRAIQRGQHGARRLAGQRQHAGRGLGEFAHLAAEFPMAQRASAGSTGTSMKRSNSLGASAVSKMPWTNIAAAMRRSPLGPSATAVAPSAGSTATQSAAGSACARLPPIVPRCAPGDRRCRQQSLP